MRRDLGFGFWVGWIGWDGGGWWLGLVFMEWEWCWCWLLFSFLFGLGLGLGSLFGWFLCGNWEIMFFGF